MTSFDPYKGLPRRVHVGSYVFPVKLVADADPILDGADGMTMTEEGAKTGIYLSELMSVRRLLEIFLHEVHHTLNWNCEIDNTSEDEGALLNMDEEDLTTKLGFAWSQFWLDNPRAQAWLTRTLNQIRRDQKEG